MQLTAGFAALALLLGALGIYAVVAHSVAERRREIGIRLALGAQPRTRLRQIVRGALGLAVAGAAIGVVSALGLTRFLETLLFGVEPTDAATFAAMAALLMAIAAARGVVAGAPRDAGRSGEGAQDGVRQKLLKWG